MMGRVGDMNRCCSTETSHELSDRCLTCRQGVTARPGARFGPSGIRRGSSRISADGAWSIYTGMFDEAQIPRLRAVVVRLLCLERC